MVLGITGSQAHPMPTFCLVQNFTVYWPMKSHPRLIPVTAIVALERWVGASRESQLAMNFGPAPNDG